MEINFNIIPRSLLIGFSGITIGCISAFSFAVINFEWTSQINVLFARFVPGEVFGLAISVIYYVNSEQRLTLRLVGAGAITVVGVICYQIALEITFWTIFFGGDLVLTAAPAGAAVGGFVATWIFVSFLQMVTNKYSAAQFKFSLYGGLLGALLIDPIAYVMYEMSDITATNTDARVLFSSCVFFIGWQTIMLLIIGGPLLKKGKKADNQRLRPPTAVNDAAPR